MDATFELTVNNKPAKIVTDPDRPLLDVLREELSLTGTKYGCGEGECGACTVLVDGKATRSCITTVAEAAGRQVTTIEGISPTEELHPVQQAFIELQAMQCGYCVPGQIISAIAFLRENPQPKREEIVAAMCGNLCRCCNYPSLLAAIERAGRLAAGETSQ